MKGFGHTGAVVKSSLAFVPLSIVSYENVTKIRKPYYWAVAAVGSRKADHIAGQRASEDFVLDKTLVVPSWEQLLCWGSGIQWAAVMAHTAALRQKHKPARGRLAE